MIKLATLQFNPFGENTYVIYNDSKECVIVDAGCYSQKEQQTLKAFIDKNGLTPIMALNTHGHIDHICGVEFVKREWKIPFALHRDDTTILELALNYSSAMGFEMESVPVAEIDLSENTQIKLGKDTINIIHTPGHTPGGVCIHIPEIDVLLSGDTLFRESIGRTDLPGGSYTALMDSIIERIIPLGGNTEVYPGHGGKTSVSHEIMFNPFITEAIQGQVNYKSNEN